MHSGQPTVWLFLLGSTFLDHSFMWTSLQRVSVQPGVRTSVLKSISADNAAKCAHAGVLESRRKGAFQSKALENV